MQSLRDKLLKAGLVSEEAAKKAESEKTEKKPPAAARSDRRDEPRRDDHRRDDNRRDDHRRDDRRRDEPRRDDRRGPPPRGAAPAGPRIPKLPPLAGSKEANRLMSKKQLQLDRTIREKVLAAQVAPEPGTTTFYFVTRKQTLRRLELSEAQAKLLETGGLAVVERPDPDKIEHALVPPAVAEELLALSPRAVRFLNKAGAQVGFLSESEIQARASEATPDQAEVNEADPHDEPAESADATDGTFITIKRAPLP